MDKEKIGIPKLRFPGFTGAWEQRRLGDYLSIPTKEPITDINELKLMTLKLNLEGITLSANRETLKLGATKYYKRHEGQLLYGKQNFFHGSIALIPKEAEGYATSGDVPALDISNVNSKYLVDYISRPSYFKAKEALATGTGSKRIHEKTLLNFKIAVPSLEEQNAISDFITNYTNLIALHQRKLEHLKQQKNGLLQKMFPKNGESVPDVRFPGFTDPWEQWKLGDFGKVAMNKRIFKNQTSEKGDVPFYKIGTFGGIADSYISHELFEEYKSKYPYPQKGDLLISASGSIGRIIEYKGKDEYFQDSNIVWLDHDGRLSNSFLKQFYHVVKWQGLEGSTIKRLYNKNILATKISVPAISEQNRIGNFLQQIDSLIALYQRKLEHLELLKKGLLQQMFV
ncbi:restriction endonuclease subunit S [Ligilactobacillus agilis]|uniref:Restriction endonuclease subunit S n=1 Tax=Ligilactobacillus agilis TaxID=1601 RepID=A0A9Q9J5H0_9LACO|nr:restriction endonuclease subunit S [Ligilactobacillus agilis]UXC64252.1 restriction endonuclease subunit S [Ligilactobacillus agilis]UXC66252.1 restriction endonuclease subunit S [Ligilactobacillus agilis]